ncbi:ATP-dependent Clp protease ATP-binding subunit ClpA [Helicobacter didelphidarum]|uniref:Chaperone protein ClpB n=1 Tax=Helicobacter didelphidarum TaxID=2040648 RepID=A0A3D8IQ35_9HELI|nr:AAA family ATPase [Helicobacter didelphidarum]RDU67035.1 ATP-dependent Clp protease ATP-binding subunit ClpA [Helicobacter didelphidarum]
MSKIDENLGGIFEKAFNLVEDMHHNIMTIEHVFYTLLRNPAGNELVSATGANVIHLTESIMDYLERYIPKTKIPKQIGNTDALRTPNQTPAFTRVFDQMITHARLAHKTSIGIGDFFVALMHEESCYSARLLNGQGISVSEVLRVVVDFDYHENNKTTKIKDSANQLEKYAKNLNKLAIEGKIDPLIGRDHEINQISQVLCRRKKNNPILLGEAGVGKSAIVEGLALRIVQGNVPKKLLDNVIYSVDISSVIAGTKYRGEFETRIKKILAEIEKDKNTIIFFDEIHMIVGAGQSHGGGMDFSNLLKPMLGTGKLRCIGATTTSEYKTSFDKDKALARRFTQIQIDEPNEEECLQILQKIAPLYEKFHNVTYDLNAIKACVTLSSKYITEKHLPDKAIDLLDEAGAKAQLNEYGNKTTKESQQEIDQNAIIPHSPSESNSQNTSSSPHSLEEKSENQNIENIQLASHKIITQHHIELLMSDITNIPKSTINANESMLLKNLEYSLKKRIFSQDKAIEKIVEKIKINKAGLSELNRPIASFLFTGPSGVGKTELSKELAKILGIKFERIDMSEYAESHSISKLIGSPAGYVGYEEGGLLINKIRSHSHCVLLLDEIEKAHNDVYNILLQIMDSAILTDNQNNKADFKNVILIMTSNAGSKEGNSVGFFDTTINRSDRALKDTFSPEFRSRLDAVITFMPLTINDLQKIAQKYIADLNANLQEKNIILKLTQKAAKFIAQQSINTELGARETKRLIDTSIKLPLSNEILFGDLRKGGMANIIIKKDSITLEVVKEKTI